MWNQYRDDNISDGKGIDDNGSSNNDDGNNDVDDNNNDNSDGNVTDGNNSDNVNDKNTEEKMIKQEKRKNNLCRLLRAAYNLALKLAPHVSPWHNSEYLLRKLSVADEHSQGHGAAPEFLS